MYETTFFPFSYIAYVYGAMDSSLSSVCGGTDGGQNNGARRDDAYSV